MKVAMVALLFSVTLPAATPPMLEERRTYYPSGKPFEVRHFYNGREEGLQQAWTEAGELYINYEMRNGRRFGAINARPCAPPEESR